MAASAPGRNAGLGRRCLSLIYEALLLCAVLFLAALVYQTLFGQPGGTAGWTGLRATLVLAMGVYFVPQWMYGQTLPMKTWRLRLERPDGSRLTLARALARYLLALLSCFLLGLGFIWAILDREHQFLHDRLADTRIRHDTIVVPPTTS